MSKALNRCQNCGELSEYDISKNGLYCEHCGTTNTNLSEVFNVGVKQRYVPNIAQKTLSKQYIQYKCKNCQTITSNSKESQNCPSCGSADLTPTAHVNIIPDGVVPFTLSKSECSAVFKKWLKKKKLAPSNLKKLAKTQAIVPRYYPSYAFNANNAYKYTATGVEIHYKTKFRNGKRTTTTYERRYPLSGSFTNFYTNIFETGCSPINGDTLRKLAPFNLNIAKVYSPQYLFGLTSTICDINPTTGYNGFYSFVDDQNQAEVCRRHNNYDRVENILGTTTLTNVEFNTLFLPVWTLNYTYKKKSYNCYVNGNGGNVVGDAPVSLIKCLLIVLLVGGIIALFSWLLG